MLKYAYQVGVQKALEEAGLTKEAIWGAIGRAGSSVLKGFEGLSPAARAAILGAGGGGVLGGMTGVGVLPGMALGAGLGGGAMLGSRAASRAQANRFLRSISEAGRAGAVEVPLRSRALREGYRL